MKINWTRIRQQCWMKRTIGAKKNRIGFSYLSRCSKGFKNCFEKTFSCLICNLDSCRNFYFIFPKTWLFKKSLKIIFEHFRRLPKISIFSRHRLVKQNPNISKHLKCERSIPKHSSFWTVKNIICYVKNKSTSFYVGQFLRNSTSEIKIGCYSNVTYRT